MLSEKDLFNRLVTLESEKLTLSADIKQIKDDSKYDEDVNPKGISKEDIKLIAAAAKLQAKNDFEEKEQAANAVFQKYRELVEY